MVKCGIDNANSSILSPHADHVPLRGLLVAIEASGLVEMLEIKLICQRLNHCHAADSVLCFAMCICKTANSLERALQIQFRHMAQVWLKL